MPLSISVKNKLIEFFTLVRMTVFWNLEICGAHCDELIITKRCNTAFGLIDLPRSKVYVIRYGYVSL